MCIWNPPWEVEIKYGLGSSLNDWNHWIFSREWSYCGFEMKLGQIIYTEVNILQWCSAILGFEGDCPLLPFAPLEGHMMVHFQRHWGLNSLWSPVFDVDITLSSVPDSLMWHSWNLLEWLGWVATGIGGSFYRSNMIRGIRFLVTKAQARPTLKWYSDRHIDTSYT